MDTQQHTSSPRQNSAAIIVLRTLQAARGAPVRVSDIPDAPPAAVARALSRLTQQGTIQRLRKGIYYLPRETLLGKSAPSEATVLQKLLPGRARPTAVTAANLLGMSTQMAAQPEFAVYASARPRGVGSARLHLRPHRHEEGLDLRDAALLEFLRDGGRYGELSPAETCTRARAILLARPEPSTSSAEGNTLDRDCLRLDRLQRLRDAASGEPPRVRAILGALMQSAGLPEWLWRPLRVSLNPLSRFDFGSFQELPRAKEWQAKAWRTK